MVSDSVTKINVHENLTKLTHNLNITKIRKSDIFILIFSLFI